MIYAYMFKYICIFLNAVSFDYSKINVVLDYS